MSIVDLLALTPFDDGHLRWVRVWWNDIILFADCTRARKAAMRA